MNKGSVKISRFYLQHFMRYKPSKSVTVGSGRFIVLNDSDNPKIYFNFFQFLLKVLELFECRRGDLYMTANRNFFWWYFSECVKACFSYYGVYRWKTTRNKRFSFTQKILLLLNTPFYSVPPMFGTKYQTRSNLYQHFLQSNNISSSTFFHFTALIGKFSYNISFYIS